MLAEIEESLIKVLRDCVKGVPNEKIFVGAKASTAPAITILNRGFKIESQITEGTGHKNVELEESFSIEGDQPSYRLKNKPTKDKITVESPPGALLRENVDYTVNINPATITFMKNAKTKLKGTVRYSTQTDYSLKMLKLGAKYVIDVWGEDWNKTDALAEEVMKILLLGNEEFESQKIHLKLVAGRTVAEEGKDDEKRIQLVYLFERELEIETVAPPITKIEITQKKP